ncbi:phytanoyl-CoA dioxygenase family protein [Oceanicola sp. 502str15]|uniref:phytanoyl-CoA dioxygenase family protein n=1 Tax=Oceanicola sp. 502str15 TaxID=2696061 RepID=UPI0020947098|nr:phytanoyl-CoA dioxygenase family protein [Oceanicola sp. 502str15]MCO6384144.1 phytanoyl-CoA dioxygenase [Oceanicola sp. 502str15]
MKDANHVSADERRRQVWISRNDGSLDELKRICDRTTNLEDWPHAVEVEQNVLIYDAADAAALQGEARLSLMAEWATVFRSGPGVIVLRGAIPDEAVIDKATATFSDIIAEEKDASSRGDYFITAGSNDRVWNSLQKHCLADPKNFADYFKFPAIDIACRAWLGPGYQMTAQCFRVNPGGKAQDAHRDYHLGFMTPKRQESYPGHVQELSPMLTLQGAVAHIDMPIETGPTLYLPYSQNFYEGYLAFEREEFQEYFKEARSQLPMKKGDAVFFNPAVMHGAGANVTEDRYRLVNLLQVSSAMGRTMEAIDRTSMIKALYPELVGSGLSDDELDRVVAASAEGYAFPTNLDTDPAVGGMSPKTHADMMREALAKRTSADEFAALIDTLDVRRKA